jgi:2-polyprenyl-3-methyl-5-hydroxy-6-metoxy-1,4-benzoquinol methylase
MKFINNELKKKKCRLCCSEDLEIIYKFKKSPVGDDYTKKIKKLPRYELKLQLCNSCKFVQLSNVINPDKVYGEYLYVTKTSHGLVQHFQNLYQYLLKSKIVKQKSKILEIGSNDGSLLKFFKKNCKELLAVDPAAHLFKDKKIKNIGKHFTNKTSFEILKDYGKFDTIIANNVLANIDDLDDMFCGIKNILNQNGHLVVETFSLYGIIQNNLIDNIYHEHLSYFTIESFSKFAKKYGLFLKEVKFLQVKGGSLRFIFKNAKLKITKKNSEFIKREKNILKNIKKSFKILRELNFKNSKKLNLLINSKKIKKEKILGFGASVGTTTLIYDFMLENKIDYLFDNEKRRHNLYCPGTKIKVLNPKLIKKLNSEYIIIFAWRYAKVIIKKNKKYFKKNVKFVIPLPKLKILQ